MKTVRRLIALALLAGLFVVAWVFASRNAKEIEVVDLLLYQIPKVPIWMALSAAFGIGALSAGVALVYQVLKKDLVARRYRKTVRSLESEIHQLRNLPLAGTDSAPALRSDAEGEESGIASRSA
jgi:hypothetical protein